MSKKGIILSFTLLLAVISANCLYFVSLETPIGSDNQNDKKIDDSIEPKSSSYTITEKWNYTGPGYNDVLISADGNYIALRDSRDWNISLFHKNSNDTLWDVDCIPNSVNSLDISADGKYISAGNNDGSVYLINNTEATPSWSKTFMWEYLTGAADLVHVAISGDGRYTAAASETGLHLLDNSLKSNKWTYSTGSPWIRAVDIGYNPIEGRYYIAIGDGVGNVTLFDDTSPVPLWRNDTTASISTMKISDDGSHILARNSEYEVYLFDNTVQTSKLALWNYTTPDMIDVDISADGKHIIVYTEDKVQYLNNTVADPIQPEWEATTSTYISEGAISGDGKYILIGISPSVGGGIAELYNSTKTQPKVIDWQVTPSNMRGVAINGFGNYFAVLEQNILYFYHHDVPLPRAIVSRSGGGGGGDDDDEVAIPFGNFYLAFMFIAIISLIVIAKKKEIFKLK